MSTQSSNQPSSAPDSGSTSVGTGRAADMSGFYKVAVIVLSIVVVGLLAVTTQGSNGNATPQTTVTVTVTANPEAGAVAEPVEAEPVEDPEQIAFLLSLPRRLEGDPLAKGSVDAPVVMTEWADFRCPFCSVFAEDTLPELQPLVDDGTLRIEFRDLAIFGEDSINAAAGARAAGEQGLYWEFSGALYASLPNEGHPAVTDADVLAIAEQVGVPDLEQFVADYNDPATLALIEADTAEAQGFGVSSTPSFLVGSQFVAGAQPLEVFEQVIAEELLKVG